MAQDQKFETLGPIQLMPGISKTNTLVKIYSAGIMVATFTGMSFMNAYILEAHLGIPRGQQGTVSGDLTFWTEIVSLLLMGSMGVLSDRIGRRPVFVFGMLAIGLGYGLYPFATSVGELLAYRLIYAVGLAACASMMATMTNDYPQENSRGKLIGITSMMNVVGVILMSTGIARIPHILVAQAWDPIAAGQAAFLFAAGLAFTTALIARLGLKEGTPVAPKDRERTRVLVTSGLRAGKNPRIALSYAGAFAARSDLVIKGMFLVLWAIHDGSLRDLSPAASMARFGLVMALMQGVSFVAAPFFGWYIDNVNRVTATIVALAFASAGYLSMGIISSPLDLNMLPYFIILGLGSSFMLKASLGLVGQEAPVKERGSVVAMNGMFGALGILILSLVGGRLFDSVGPWAPFVIAGAYQVLLLLWAIWIRIYRPGPKLVESRWQWKWPILAAASSNTAQVSSTISAETKSAGSTAKTPAE